MINTVRYTVDGVPATREKALAAWRARDPAGERSEAVFDRAHETDTIGYQARFYLEQEDVTLRHAHEEQVRA